MSPEPLSRAWGFGFRVMGFRASGMYPNSIDQGPKARVYAIFGHTVDDIDPASPQRTLNYGNYGMFLIMGIARFISSTVWTLRQKGTSTHLLTVYICLIYIYIYMCVCIYLFLYA